MKNYTIGLQVFDETIQTKHNKITRGQLKDFIHEGKHSYLVRNVIKDILHVMEVQAKGQPCKEPFKVWECDVQWFDSGEIQESVYITNVNELPQESDFTDDDIFFYNLNLDEVINRSELEFLILNEQQVQL